MSIRLAGVFANVSDVDAWAYYKLWNKAPGSRQENQ